MGRASEILNRIMGISFHASDASGKPQSLALEKINALAYELSDALAQARADGWRDGVDDAMLRVLALDTSDGDARHDALDDAYISLAALRHDGALADQPDCRGEDHSATTEHDCPDPDACRANINSQEV